MDKTVSDKVFDDNRESTKIRHLETIVDNTNQIVKQLQRIADILEKLSPPNFRE